MIEILPESLVLDDQKIIVEKKVVEVVEKEIIKEVDKINERIIERPVIVEKEKIVLTPDGRTNELNKHLVDIISQLEVLKGLVKEYKILPTEKNYEVNFETLHRSILDNNLKIVNHIDNRIQTVQETVINSKPTIEKKVEVKDYTNEINTLYNQVKLILTNLQELKNTPIVLNEVHKRINELDLKIQTISNVRNLSIKVDEVSNLNELPSAVQFLMSEVKELPYKVEQISKQINDLKLVINSIEVKPEVKIETKETKIDLSNIESRLQHLLTEVTKPIQFPEQEKLNFGIDDLVSVINEIRLMNGNINKTIEEKHLLILQNLEAVINASFGTFKNLLKIIPEKHEVEVNVIDNEKVISLLDTINLQTFNILNNQESEKELQLEFDLFENLPNPYLWKGKTVLVFRVKRKYWFDKKNVLFYSTGINWVKI